MVIGFPGIGLVGSIATAYLQRSLRLREVGAVVSPAFPPTAVVYDGVCSSPVRILLGDVVCGREGDCEQLCVVHSDIAPKSGTVAGLAHVIVSWAKERGARQLVCLEGFKTDGNRPEEVRVFGVVNDPRDCALLARLGVSSIQDGLLTGIGGVALYAARAVGLPALCLLAESREDFPDARGSAKLLELLHPLVPLVPIDERPLYMQAQVFEATLSEQIERSNRAARDLSRRADMMFG